MRTYCTMQGTLQFMLCGDLNGKRETAWKALVGRGDTERGSESSGGCGRESSDHAAEFKHPWSQLPGSDHPSGSSCPPPGSTCSLKYSYLPQHEQIRSQNPTVKKSGKQ